MVEGKDGREVGGERINRKRGKKKIRKIRGLEKKESEGIGSGGRKRMREKRSIGERWKKKRTRRGGKEE